jgi:hypothetical protein
MLVYALDVSFSSSRWPSLETGPHHGSEIYVEAAYGKRNGSESIGSSRSPTAMGAS